MYPSPERPEYGVFVQRLAQALRARGHEVDEAVLTAGRRGGLRTPMAYLGLLRRTRSLVRSRRPDVVYAHFLVPTGVVAAMSGAPFVVTAHGRDVANAEAGAVLAAVTRRVIARARAVIAVSSYLAELLPSAPRRLEVIDCGVDTSVFRPAPPAAGEGPRYLIAGSLIERKNVERLMQAFASLGTGTLTVAGSGPLEARLRASAPAGVIFLGRVEPAAMAALYGDCDVYCQPSLVEPQGQALLEALACGRPVVATCVGGPPEYVSDACGALIDPLDVTSIADGMRRAAAIGVPCGAAIEVAEQHSIGRQAARIEALLADVSSGDDG